jgi:hypothetical protein
MKTSKTTFLAFIAAVATATLLTGCGTTAGYSQADKTGAGIAEFREEIVNGKAAIDGTMKALDQIAVSASTDPRKSFEQFAKSMANLESTAASARKRSQGMKDQGKAYFTQWEKQLSEVKNEEIRNLAMERKAKLQATFDNIKQVAEPLKEKFEPWMSNLKDLQTFLGNDLTIAGVDAVKPLFVKTRAEGIEIQKSMDALVGELNTISAVLTPARAPAKK